MCTLLCEISPQLNYVTVDILHSDPVYHSTQLLTCASPLSCALTNIKANIQVLFLKLKNVLANITFESF